MANTQFPPAHACDCHVHVIGPKNRYPLARKRTYTPKDALLTDLRAMLARLGLERVVLIQPSIYGTDNSCMMDAIDALDGKARGVAMLPADAAAAELDDLHRRGIRGLRVNIASGAMNPLDVVRERLIAAARLCDRNDWHVQLFLPAHAIVPLSKTLLVLPVPVVIDHFALVPPGEAGAEARDGLLRLLDSRQVWVKLSAPYRIADDMADAAVGALARRLAAANSERIVWGSDWPHTPKHGELAVGGDEELAYRDIDTRTLLGLVQAWLPDPRLQRLLLADNPARLYGFS